MCADSETHTSSGGVGYMGASSAASIKNLLKAANIEDFLAENQENMLTMNLSEYLMTLLRQKKLKRADVIRDSHLEHAYVYQIFNGTKKPTRDKLIAIAFGLHLNVEETQRMLRLGGCSELYARVGRDAVILFAVSRGMSIGETDELLDTNGFPTLVDPEK